MRIAYIVAVGLVAASLLGGAARAQESGPYRVIRIQLTGGEGGWDYVTADPDGRHLFVARSGPTGHIGIYNLDTLEQVGDIPDVSAHGGEVDTETGHGFATSNPVTMFWFRQLDLAPFDGLIWPHLKGCDLSFRVGLGGRSP